MGIIIGSSNFRFSDEVEGVVALELPAQVVDLLQIHPPHHVHTHRRQNDATHYNHQRRQQILRRWTIITETCNV